jgi:hypothetical protein
MSEQIQVEWLPNKSAECEFCVATNQTFAMSDVELVVTGGYLRGRVLF